jgi:hypothetical protein
MLNVDPQNPETLLGMWSGMLDIARWRQDLFSQSLTVFHKCTGFIEDGRRLENLSWRVFAHETLCSTPRKRQEAPMLSTSTPLPISKRPQHESTQLSSSVDSNTTTSTESAEDASTIATTPGEELQVSFDASNASWDRSRQGEKHITSKNLRNLITSIKVKQDLTRPLSPLPLSMSESHLEREEPTPIEGSLASSAPTTSSAPTPRPSSPQPALPVEPVQRAASPVPMVARPASPVPIQQPQRTGPRVGFERRTSPSVGSNGSYTSVTRGFEPGKPILSVKSQTQLALAMRKGQACSSSPEVTTASAKRKHPKFTLGGSMQESDSDHMRDNFSPMPHSSLRAPNQSTSTRQKKHASFAEHVTEMPQKKPAFALPSSNEDATASDNEDAIDDDDMSDSAIDDGGDDWEDEEEEQIRSTLTFGKVDSSVNLTSRRSILTAGLHQGQRASAMQNAASRSTPMLQNLRRSPRNGPSMPVSPEEEPEFVMDAGSGDSSAPIPMVRSSINMTGSAPLALSPRATRRNMLSKELGMSLRKHMLNERQQRNIIPVASGLPRRHTTQDMKNLTKHPEAPSDDQTPAASGPSGIGMKKDYFQSGFTDYHQKGW